MSDGHQPNRKWYQAIGPALITACVVIGPGSIMTSSNVGATMGYSMAWVVVVSVIFMLIYMSMGAKLGVACKDSAATVLTNRFGRPFAVLLGVSVFFISAAFQFGNNLGVHYALNEFFAFDYWVVILNGLAIAFLLAFKDLYRALEKLMMAFVGLMLFSFALNLGMAVLSDPRPGEIVQGFVPSASTFDWNVLGLIGTTFVTSAAFYQSYLVRQKGWTANDLKTGMVDVRVGAILMALITLMLMFTPATLYNPTFKHQSFVSSIGDSKLTQETLVIDLPEDSEEFKEAKKNALEDLNARSEDKKWTVIAKSAFDSANAGLEEPAKLAPRSFRDVPEVGQSLKPLFGGLGPSLFFLGVFAAAYSSFLVNSMIGGFILADGLGIGSRPEDKWPRIFTIVVLLTGMSIGLLVITTWKTSPVPLIVAAQAVTVIASPLVAGSILWLTSDEKIVGKDLVNSPLMIGLGALGFILLLGMSAHTIYFKILPKLG